MNVDQIMTSDAVCCARETTLADCAQLMLRNDCGCIPITDSESRVIGVVTDRDITCRAVAQAFDSSTAVEKIMTADPVVVRCGSDVKEAERLMREAKVRRIPVVSEEGRCLGMVAQADIALSVSNDEVAAVVKSISGPYAA